MTKKRCHANHTNCTIYHGPWQTPTGKWASRNKNKVIKYYTNKQQAMKHRNTKTGTPRDYSTENYERRRQQFFKDFNQNPKGSGYLGNISNKFPPPNSQKAKKLIQKLQNNTL